MVDGTGTRFHFTVTAGMAEVVEVEFYLSGGVEPLDMRGAGLMCEVVSEVYGDVVEVPVEHGEGVGRLLMYLPALAAGGYDYRVCAVDGAGGRSVLLYGVLSALSVGEFDAEVAEAAVCERRRLALVVPQEEGVPMMVRWKGSSMAGGAAVRAVEAAAKAEVAAQQLAEAQAFIDSFNAAVKGAVRVDEDGYLWVADYYTGVCARGKDGVTPHIGANGHWWVGDVDTGHEARGEAGAVPSVSADGFWVIGGVKSGVRAAGRDGIDGSAVRRVLVDSVAELPQEGERCNGGFIFYVPNADGEYDVYAWLERGDEAGWVRVKEAYDIATAEVYGLSKLGTDLVASEGAPVAVNAEGGMVVQVASTVDYGAVKASSSVVEKFGGGGIYVSNGALWVNMATPNKPGCVIYSAWGTTPDNYCIGPNTSGWIDVMNAGTKQRGVVLAARDMADGRDGAVPEAKQVKAWVEGNYMTAVQVRDELAYSEQEVKSWGNEQFARKDGVYTRDEVDTKLTVLGAQRYTKDEVNKKLGVLAKASELNALRREAILRSEVWSGDVVLTEAEYNRLTEAEIDESKVYFIV